MNDYSKYAEIMDLAVHSSIEELYELLGDELSHSQLGISPSDPAKYHQKVKDFASQAFSKISEIACSDKFRAELDRMETEDERKAAYLIADLLVGIAGGVPAIYLSLLFLKIGLKHLCPTN